jgi:hypothetical protein
MGQFLLDDFQDHRHQFILRGAALKEVKGPPTKEVAPIGKK